MGKSKISMAVVRRLPKYYRYLCELIEKDIKRVSSQELGKLTGFTASQIRQDLNNFGGFGQQGYGYNVTELKNELGKIIGISEIYNSVIIGVGNLGQAITNYRRLGRVGINLIGLFDKNPKVVGLTIGGIKVRDTDELGDFVRENNIKIGIICTPKEGSQETTDILVENGAKGIWNFSPADLKVPSDVVVENVHLTESLFTLSFLLNQSLEDGQ